MINEPLFENNIIENILRNFTFYFFGQIWYIYALLLGIIMYVSYRLICKGKLTTYPNLFPLPIKDSNLKNKNNIKALIALFCALYAYATIMFIQDNSLFNNPDLMSLNTIFIFHRGVAATYGPARMCPISFFDLNYLYAISHNFTIINLYILLKQAIILWLLYKFLNFLSFSRRLWTIALIQITPSVFWLNNIIFPEQNIIIFVLCSLLCLQKFSQTEKKSFLWWFCVFTLLAIYSKETTILFYGGILIFAVLYNVYKEKITPSDFLHPFKLAGKLPLEALLFLCCLSFAVFYLFIMVELKENVYIVFRQHNLIHLINLYKFEIICLALGWILALYRLLNKQILTNPIFNEGLLFAATFLLGILIFRLQIAPDLQHVSQKSYYAVLADIFGIIYITRNLHHPKLQSAFSLLIIIGSMIINLQILRYEEIGLARHQAADYLSDIIQTQNKLSFMLSMHTEESDWVREGWGGALTYYHPSAELTLKMPTLADNNIINKFSLHEFAKYKAYLPTIKGEYIPQSGDYYIIKEDVFEQDYPTIKDLEHELVFKNKLFRIYKIK